MAHMLLSLSTYVAQAAYVDDEISFKIKNNETDDNDPAAASGGSKVVSTLSYTAMHGSPEQVMDTQRQMQSLHQEAAEKNHTVRGSVQTVLCRGSGSVQTVLWSGLELFSLFVSILNSRTLYG